MSRNANVVFLLHMHQPQYVEPRSGRALLPWVRLHGARGYLNVARLLYEHEAVRLTVNFVPSLVQQLAEVASGAPGTEDEWLRIALLEGWNDAERAFAVERFFSLNWDRGVRTRPRYLELLDQRERKQPFSDADVRDLTVLFNLGWLGFAARQNDREIAELEHKGRGYTRDDLLLVVERQRSANARVLPLYRQLAERGQIELSTSPFYHPIVPLLVDTEHARRAMPHASLPPRFAWPDDATLQIVRGKEAHARAFGASPAGMWPPEGSVSPEAVARYAEAGIGWLATDEGNLWRSLEGVPHGRGDLYRAWRYHGVDLVFRDREISDKVGFAYAHGDAASGVADLVGRARAAAAQSSAPDGEPALVPIFLDGENPWESYPDDGEPFLRALFTALTHDAQLKTATVKQHLADAPSRRELPTLHSGSWIDSDFHIWIADPIKNRAWELLGQARAAFANTQFSDESARAAAHERLLAAEGSDWFWWFGEPFHSMEDALFDALFRAHLSGAYQAMGKEPPRALDEPVAQARPVAAEAVSAPYAFITPRIGGDGFYDWQGAGRYAVPRGAAMADNPLVTMIRFGFDRVTLYLRLEPSDARATELMSATVDLEISVGEARVLWHLGGDELVREGAETEHGGQVARRRTLELAAPLVLLGARAGDRLSLVVRVRDDKGAPLGRYPADGAIRVTVPGDEFEAENWSA
jgi:alpha-amylase/alpha-mannosidase (GH57 family)